MSFCDLQIDEVEDAHAYDERDTDGGDAIRDRHEALTAERDYALMQDRRRTAYGD